MTEGIGENLLVGGMEPTNEHAQGTEQTVEVKEDVKPVEQEKPAEPQKFKVNANGVEEEKTVEELVKAYNLEKASYKRFEEAAEERRKIQEERMAFEQQKQQHNQTSQIEQWKRQAEQDANQFKGLFEQQFATEFLPMIPGNEWQQAVFNDYMMNLASTRQQAQQARMSLQQVQTWRDTNPEDARRVEDAAWASKDRSLISALDAIEAGSATQAQVEQVRKFGEKVLSAPKAQPIPPAISKPQAPVIPQPSAPAEEMRGEDEIDWDKFRSDTGYQSKMFGAYLRQQKR